MNRPTFEEAVRELTAQDASLTVEELAIALVVERRMLASVLRELDAIKSYLRTAAVSVERFVNETRK